MNNTVNIFGSKLEYDFLSGWIKYNRIQAGISQEALAHGICSTSHLSYFENGRKKLRSELIEALLKKLKITSIVGLYDVGLVRQKLHRLMVQVEGFEYESAAVTYSEILALEELLLVSPYNIELNIYKLMYDILVERKGDCELGHTIDVLDKIYFSLNNELQHLYLLITGKFFYDNLNHGEGIRRLEEALKLKDTPWANYRLGVAYCLNWEHLKSIIYLEKALNNYVMSGRYRNSLECHSFLGISYTFLRIYDQAEFHFKSVHSGSDYFTINKNIFSVYTNLANLYYKMGRFEESISYCQLAMNSESLPEESHSRWLKAAWHFNEQPMLGACIYVEIYKKLNNSLKCKEIFDKYLIKENKGSLYYKYLYSLYLCILHFDEDLFYKEITNSILPFYKEIGYLNIYNKVQVMLIQYLESKRRYKEANNIYKELNNISEIY